MKIETIDREQVLEKVREAFTRRKGYASFWDYPDKQVKERGVVRDLIEAIELEEMACRIRHLYSNPDKHAPVDIFGTDVIGNVIAYEVTELVSEEAIRLNRRGIKVCRKWDRDDLIANLNDRLAAKDSQLSRVAFEEQVVVVFTDEPRLSHRWCVPRLSDHSFGPFANFHHAYLLFSYDPGRERYPYIKLNFR